MNIIVLDTETTNDIESCLAYDIGWLVMDEHGEILTQRSFVVTEIFRDEFLMSSAYYKSKIGQYKSEIESGEREETSLFTIREYLKFDCRFWGVEGIVMHNAIFDYHSLGNTIRYLTKSKERYFLPYGVEIFDSLKMSRAVLGKDEVYREWCTDRGYLTSRGMVRLTAEVLYRYIREEEGFEESHTGLEDCLIEKEIYMDMLRRNPSVERRLFVPKKVEIWNGCYMEEV